jgi:hypothetical protein
MNASNGPRWANTWWGKRTTIVNLAILALILAFVVLKALFP